MAYDVITLGSAALDLFVDTDSELISMQTPSSNRKHICYPSGTKLIVKEFNQHTGGGGTNTAVSFSRLGIKTAYLGNLGNDDRAEIILKELKKEKIDFIGTRTKEHTNYSIILDSIEHDRTILAFRGSSDSLSFRRIDKSRLKTKWFYMSSLMGRSLDASFKILKFAKKNSIHTAVNISSYLAKKGKVELKNMLESVDVLIFNKEEAQELLRSDSENIGSLLLEVRALGPSIVVITDGKNGAHCYDGEHHYSINTSKVRVRESTGAGDAFASSFIAAMIKGKEIQFALKLGIINAQSVIQFVGAKNQLLKWREALKYINTYKLKVVKKRLG